MKENIIGYLVGREDYYDDCGNCPNLFEFPAQFFPAGKEEEAISLFKKIEERSKQFSYKKPYISRIYGNGVIGEKNYSIDWDEWDRDDDLPNIYHSRCGVIYEEK